MVADMLEKKIQNRRRLTGSSKVRLINKKLSELQEPQHTHVPTGLGVLVMLMFGGSTYALLGMSIAAALAAGWIDLSSSQIRTIAIVSGILTGTGRGLLICLWGLALRFESMPLSLMLNVLSIGFSAIVYYLCCLLPGMEITAGVACAALGPFFADTRTIVERLGAANPSPGHSVRPTTHTRQTRTSRQRAVIVGSWRWPLVLAAFIFGILSGYISGIYELLPYSGTYLYSWGRIPATFVAAIAALLLATFLKKCPIAQILRLSILLAAISFFLLQINLQIISRFFNIFGYQLLFTMLWIIINTHERAEQNPILSTRPVIRSSKPIMPVELFALCFGIATSLLAWGAGKQLISTWDLRLISGTALLILVILAIIPSHIERPRLQSEIISSANMPRSAMDTGELIGIPESLSSHLAVRYGFTLREIEVCDLLMRSQSRKFIADELGISLQTAKTHVANIYRKLDVHSFLEFSRAIESISKE